MDITSKKQNPVTKNGDGILEHPIKSNLRAFAPPFKL